MLTLEILILCFLLNFFRFLFLSSKTEKGFQKKRYIKHSVFSFSASYLILFAYFKDHRLLAFSDVKAGDYIITLCVTVAVSCAIFALSALLKKLNAYGDAEKCEPNKKYRTACIIVTAVSVSFFLTMVFIKKQWNMVEIEQMLVNMFSPTEGTEISIYLYGFSFVLAAVCITYAAAVVLFARFIPRFKVLDKKAVKQYEAINFTAVLLFFCAIFALSFIMFFDGYNPISGYNCLFVKSDYIEENYVAADSVKLEAPEKPRNLIHIYLESVENTYLSKELGGYMDENLMPELTKLADEGIVFSDNSERFGGPQPVTGTTWSLASMVNQNMGIPLKFTGGSEAYCTEGSYIKNAVAMGDILEKQGYEQTVMIGSSAVFGGLGNMYITHGGYNVFDYNYAKENGYIPKDYYVWWGYEDDKLYEFAKEEITRLYKTGKPFNFTMENADTHMPDGYLEPDKPHPYASPYANAILYSTSQVEKFVRWIMAQPFYENTTIVLIGDHLSMDSKFFENVDESYHRSQFNLIINPAVSADPSRLVNRTYSNIDMYPTILAALGYKIEGERLGLGTNLFSKEKTLLERDGVEYVNTELTKKSEFYNNELSEID